MLDLALIPLWQVITMQHVLIIAAAMMMTGTLIMGMLRRENPGFAHIGFESAAILVLYAGLVTLMLV